MDEMAPVVTFETWEKFPFGKVQREGNRSDPKIRKDVSAPCDCGDVGEKEREGGRLTVFNEMPLSSIGRICFDMSLLILEARTLLKTDCFTFKFLISHLLRMLMGMRSKLAKFRPNLLATFRLLGLNWPAVWKDM